MCDMAYSGCHGWQASILHLPPQPLETHPIAPNSQSYLNPLQAWVRSNGNSPPANFEPQHLDPSHPKILTHSHRPVCRQAVAAQQA